MVSYIPEEDFFMVTAVKTSNLTYVSGCYVLCSIVFLRNLAGFIPEILVVFLGITSFRLISRFLSAQ
jgi:hypothetical protein